MYTRLCWAQSTGKEHEYEPNLGGQGESWQVVWSGMVGGGVSQLRSSKWLLVASSTQTYMCCCTPVNNKIHVWEAKWICSVDIWWYFPMKTSEFGIFSTAVLLSQTDAVNTRLKRSILLLQLHKRLLFFISFVKQESWDYNVQSVDL